MSHRASFLLFGAIISLIVIEASMTIKLLSELQTIGLIWKSFDKLPDSIQFKHCPTWCIGDTTNLDFYSTHLDALNIIEPSNFIKFT